MQALKRRRHTSSFLISRRIQIKEEGASSSLFLCQGVLSADLMPSFFLCVFFINKFDTISKILFIKPMINKQTTNEGKKMKVQTIKVQTIIANHLNEIIEAKHSEAPRDAIKVLTDQILDELIETIESKGGTTPWRNDRSLMDWVVERLIREAYADWTNEMAKDSEKLAEWRKKTGRA